MKYDVFISYSRKDSAIADQICAAFDKAGISYFIDTQEIGGGSVFGEVLTDSISNSQVFLFLGSKNSYESIYTTNELYLALRLLNEKKLKSIIPYLIDETPLHEYPNFQYGFASISIRNIKEHPIETTLVDDIHRSLAKPMQIPKTSSDSRKAHSLDIISKYLEDHPPLSKYLPSFSDKLPLIHPPTTINQDTMSNQMKKAIIPIMAPLVLSQILTNTIDSIDKRRPSTSSDDETE